MLTIKHHNGGGIRTIATSILTGVYWTSVPVWANGAVTGQAYEVTLSFSDKDDLTFKFFNKEDAQTVYDSAIKCIAENDEAALAGKYRGAMTQGANT